MSADERLTLRDLLSLRHPARLAVLSACETGVPGVALPDEVISLATGMLQAGACGVVSSLWPVNDVSTVLLMMRFYECWRQEDQDPAVALTDAQRWLRGATNRQIADKLYGREDALHAVALRLMLAPADARPFAHPYYWAGFCHTGA